MRFFVFVIAFGLFGTLAIQGMYLGGPREPYYEEYTPVYLSWMDLRGAIKSEPAKTIGKRGKIFIRDGTLFLNEPNKGVHVFDNRDPSKPLALAFINIPGNLDLAVRGSVLFVDSFVDLVAIDIQDMSAIKELNRQVDVFPYDAMQTAEGDHYFPTRSVDKKRGVVIAWKNAKSSK